jgi:ATP-dependent DNA helicase RecG
LPLQYLKGVGPKRAAALDAIGIHSVQALLHYFPRGYLDRSTILPIGRLRAAVGAGDPVTVIGEVVRSEVRRTKRRSRSIFFLVVRDSSGVLTCVWFEGAEWYRKAFEAGEVLALSAVPSMDSYGRVQFVHPEFDRLRGSLEEDEPDWGGMVNTGAIVPKYPSSAELAKVGLDSRGFRRIIRPAVQRLADEVPDHLSEALRSTWSLAPLSHALRGIHFPADGEDLSRARRRLKFDELFAFQLMLALRKRRLHDDRPGIAFSVESALARRMVESLPFTLTGAQRKVIREITDDMREPKPMNRLLQGDVGSGKTVVALLAMLIAIENDFQAAFMAPTEILAEQHFSALRRFLGDLPVSVRLLLGGQKRRLREDVLEDVRRGSAHITVGTHALLEEHVSFAKLGLVVIDEQHRFGVLQRAALQGKGRDPDVLVMTATPIPRTLAMTLYGDLDVSVIDEMPADRKPIKTAVRMESQKERVYEFVRQEIQRGRQAYVVFPLIEESEKLDLKAATKEFDHLRSMVFPHQRLGLLHGRLSTEDKDAVMTSFRNGQTDILVATTVIEVGIDVPNATVMLIENAERFGLSQLHQLRGRVGRGADQSYCILIADYEQIEHRKGLAQDEVQREKRAAMRRLETMVETNDGFRIAEVDLELRGPGEVFGIRQSGMPELKIADLVEDKDLLVQARHAAFDVVARDPHLRKLEHEGLRQLFDQHLREQFALGTVG